MKTAALGSLTATLLLTGCLATAPKNEAAAPASTAAAASPAAPAAQQAAPAAASAVPAAAAPCKPEPAAARTTKGKAKPRTKAKNGKTQAAAAPAAQPCKPAVVAASASAPAPEKSAAADTAGVQGKSARREVKGINDWTGYVEGEAARASKFSKLQIGMGTKEVTDLIGPPTDQRSHVTGKAWIPFYFGSGSHETYFYYKGVGRLLFAGDAGFSTGSGLIGIEHDAGEGGYGR